MASFGVYLASVSTPIVKRVFAGLGIGVVSYVGLGAVFNQVRDSLLAQWGMVPVAAMQLLSIAGVPEAMGIILGAMACRFSMLQLSAFGRVQ